MGIATDAVGIGSARPSRTLTLPVASTPVIGITSYAQPAQWGAWHLPCALIPMMYVESVQHAGGRALVVPPSTEAVEETLDALDGLLLSGGIDADPAAYGADPHSATDEPQALRDAGELALLSRALERDMPVLAICRGFQLLNVLRGGDLVQHLPEALGHERHKETPGVFSEHPVEIADGSRLAHVIGPLHDVKSHHHQGVGRVGQGLVETAWAEDGTLEGIEDPSKRFALGVLWHPEAGEDKRLFAALVEEARGYRDERLRGQA